MTTLEIWSIDRRTPLGVRGADGEAGEGYEVQFTDKLNPKSICLLDCCED